MPLSPGTQVGTYEILASLGAGGMGEVFRARDTRLGREVAIKVLPAAFSSDPDRLRRFEQEARAVAALNHPNILAIHHIASHEGSPYIVSELLEGDSLRYRIKSRTLPVRKAIDCALQIARGIASAHEKGIVHRDLKPENIFITKDGRVKILDFGLAKLTRPEDPGLQSNAPTVPDATDPGLLMGTVGYMSPEQVRGRPVDHRSDLFSFGAILYEMLSGKHAFRGETAADTMSAILKEDPPDLSESNHQVPPALERIVRHCLEKNPEERFQSARDVAFDLETLSGLSTPSAAVSPAIGIRLRKRGLLVAQLLLLIAVGVSGLLVGGKLGRTPILSFQRLTFRRGPLRAARFAPDGQTVVYSAAWDGGPLGSFSIRLNSPESSLFDLPKLGFLAISSSGEMAVSVQPRFVLFDVWRGTLARMPLGGGAPREVLEDVEWADWSPDGTTLAAVHAVGGRERLEFPIGRVVYETNGWISHPRISPKGDRIAFLDHPVLVDYHGSLAIVDLTGKRSVLSTVSSYTAGLAWSPTGNEIWFTTGKGVGGSALFAVTLSGKERVLARIPGGLTLHDVSPDGKVLLARDDVRTQIRALAPGEAKESDLPWLDQSWVDDLSADGKFLLFDEEGDGGGPGFASYLRKTDGSPPVHLGDGAGVALSPDGKWVISVVPGPPSQLLLLPTGAGNPKPLERYGLEQHDAADWFPDGKQFVFTAAQPGHGIRIYLQDLQEGKPKPITPEGVTFPWPSHPVSPDGKYLIAQDADHKLFVYPLEGGEPKVVPGAEPDEVPIRWSSDGRSIFMQRFPPISAQVYKLEVNTGRKTLARELGSSAWPTQITPDGKSYAYSYGQTLSDLYLVDGLK